MRNVEIGELLRQLTEAITGRARVPVMLNIEGSCELPPDVKVSFYHIAQDALNNVAKHARAASTRVDLFCTPDKMELLVKDDGRGFVLGEVTAEHLGLTIMRERAESIGAAIEIQSQLEQGTEVRVTWPAGVSDSRLTATPFSAKNRNEEIS